ncbi:MlaD family protein [Ahrensia marina]|uniref:MlaD family protein n=1 Tax=Ahrensia marina TaxID=1514904 RepID=UPI0035D033C5
METRANHIVIGLFALAVIAAGMAFIYWVAEIGGQDNTAEVIFQFNGPVNGLSAGSPVLFNGIQVGEVRTLSLNPNNPQEALALAVVEGDTPIRSDTDASLGITGITGTAFVALRGGSMDEPAVLDPTTPVIIEAQVSAVQDLIDGARNVLGRADDAMQTIENFLLVNEPFLTQTIADINEVTSAVASQSDNIELLMEGVGSIASEISGLSGRLEGIISGSEQLIAAVDPESVSEVVENVRVASTEFRGIGEDARTLMARGEVVFDNLEASSGTLVETLDTVQAVVEAVDPAVISQSVADVRAFTAQLPEAGERVDAVLAGAQEATESVTAFTSSLEDNAEQVDAIFEDAVVIADRLEVASRRIDGLLASVDGLLGEDETQGLIADAREAARALRNVAVSFEGRSDEIAAGLARFTGPGLRDAEALIGDGRRVLNRLERVVTSIERNPQQFIFGGDRAPEYSPQRR